MQKSQTKLVEKPIRLQLGFCPNISASALVGMCLVGRHENYRPEAGLNEAGLFEVARYENGRHESTLQEIWETRLMS